ncbi:hypothetical protein D3C84_352770 [compost metagenome]
MGLNNRQWEKRERQPAVRLQFSPLMSWMTAEAGQASRVGTTRPTPLPERVGAKASTCSGPSWRRYCSSNWPRNTPAGRVSPAWRISSASAQRAEP